MFFKDIIPVGTSFVENSVEINEVKVRCINPEEGFHLGALLCGNKIKITFVVLVLKQCLGSIIENYSLLEYDYTYNIEKPPVRVIKDSNKVKTKFENKLFKQISQENILEIKRNIDYIIGIESKIEIIQKKYIRSNRINTVNLLLIGRIRYSIEYLLRGKNKLIKDVVGFSNCILMPCGAMYFDTIDIKIHPEYICYTLIEKDKILISNTMLIYY